MLSQNTTCNVIIEATAVRAQTLPDERAAKLLSDVLWIAGVTALVFHDNRGEADLAEALRCGEELSTPGLDGAARTLVIRRGLLAIRRLVAARDPLAVELAANAPLRDVLIWCASQLLSSLGEQFTWPSVQLRALTIVVIAMLAEEVGAPAAPAYSRIADDWLKRAQMQQHRWTEPGEAELRQADTAMGKALGELVTGEVQPWRALMGLEERRARTTMRWPAVLAATLGFAVMIWLVV